MSGLLTKKWKGKQMVWVTERRELSVIKLSLRLTYCTYNNPGEKRKKITKKINAYQLHNTTSSSLSSRHFSPSYFLSFNKMLQKAFSTQDDQSSQPSFCLLYVGYSRPSGFCVIFHLSQDRSNCSYPASSSNTLQNVPAISDLLSEVFKFVHHNKLYS